jgi:glycosyltransferase involved in cell wall biosynthesis
MMREDPCDIIHANWTYEFALAALASAKPTLITAHDAPFWILRYLPDAYRAIRTAMAWQVARKASYMTAVSPYVAEHFRKWLRFRRSMTVVPNGLPGDFFARVPHPAQAQKTDRLTFACVLTGWDARKNGAAALLAFKQVHQDLPGSQLLLIGTGHGAGEPAELFANTHDCRGGVRFLGNVPYATVLDTLVNQVDVLVHPAREESFGLAIAEAMALRVPVIAGKYSGGVPFVMDYGGAGKLVDVSRPHEIAAAMLEFGRSAPLRTHFAQAGFSFAQESFNLKTVFDQYEAVYDRVLAHAN